MKINGKSYKTIWFDNKTLKVNIIDQSLLPFQFKIVEIQNFDEIVLAIKNMQIRGAPLIGATAAYGMYYASLIQQDFTFLKTKAEELKRSRPTAVNLSWAVDRILKVISDVKQDFPKIILQECEKICKEDILICEQIGNHGLKIIKNIQKEKKLKNINILTHCNAGWLATVDWGTATAPIYKAHQNKIPIHVWVDETRPRNQGSALTSYELNHEKIPNTIIADNTGGLLMREGKVDMCIVGTDRVSANGDVANKIGTYLKALAAFDNKIPFYVALPSTTIDWSLSSGNDIPIEERSSLELSQMTGLDRLGKLQKINIYPKESKSLNFAFDVTPAKYITGFITERGICEANINSLKKLFSR
jgi:methylthioribose-1-phosphate isomerase